MKNRLVNYLADLRSQRKDELQIKKKTGKIIAGYYCLYTPVEVIEACSAVPVRVMENGSYDDETRGSRFLKSDSCSFCKASLGSLTKSDFYSCIISGNTCDQIRRIHEIISTEIGIPVYLFSNPRTYGKDSTSQMFRSEIKWVIDELMVLTGEKFSEKLLSERVLKWNELRNFLKKVHNTRKSDFPLISGTDMQDLIFTAYFLGPDRFLPVIPEIENNLNESNLPENSAPVRIILGGSICSSDDRIIHNLIEENQNAVIVTDLTCTGVRWFSNLIDAKGAVFENVCDYYHLKMMCPHRRPNYPLFEFASEQIKHWKPDGMIYRTLKFCHPWTFEAKTFKEESGLPVLHLDTDYSTSNIGQLRTRIHAFLEMITAKKEITIDENNN
jgi:benzoyl-CoA reductase/2-hydroxyglutaryl-CoA dehydratase subunit BcrC/BadD/HgdB